MGCSSELSHVRGLIAVDVPPNVDYKKVRSYLHDGLKQEKWDVQESCLAHTVA